MVIGVIIIWIGQRPVHGVIPAVLAVAAIQFPAGQTIAVILLRAKQQTIQDFPWVQILPARHMQAVPTNCRV